MPRGFAPQRDATPAPVATQAARAEATPRSIRDLPNCDALRRAGGRGRHAGRLDAAVPSAELTARGRVRDNRTGRAKSRHAGGTQAVPAIARCPVMSSEFLPFARPRPGTTPPYLYPRLPEHAETRAAAPADPRRAHAVRGDRAGFLRSLGRAGHDRSDPAAFRRAARRAHHRDRARARRGRQAGGGDAASNCGSATRPGAITTRRTSTTRRSTRISPAPGRS